MSALRVHLGLSATLPSTHPCSYVQEGAGLASWSTVSFPSSSLVPLSPHLLALHPHQQKWYSPCCAQAVLAGELVLEQGWLGQVLHESCKVTEERNPILRGSRAKGKWVKRWTSWAQRPVRGKLYLPRRVGEIRMMMHSPVPGVCQELDRFFCPL